jgi:hypothetical protein
MHCQVRVLEHQGATACRASIDGVMVSDARDASQRDDPQLPDPAFEKGVQAIFGCPLTCMLKHLLWLA